MLWTRCIYQDGNLTFTGTAQQFNWTVTISQPFQLWLTSWYSGKSLSRALCPELCDTLRTGCRKIQTQNTDVSLCDTRPIHHRAAVRGREGMCPVMICTSFPVGNIQHQADQLVLPQNALHIHKPHSSPFSQMCLLAANNHLQRVSKLSFVCDRRVR